MINEDEKKRITNILEKCIPKIVNTENKLKEMLE